MLYFPNQLDIWISDCETLSRTEDWARFMDRALKDSNFKEKTNQRISECIDLIRKGFGANEVQKTMSLGKKEAAIIFELAHSRINLKGKFQNWDMLWMDQYLSRYSTPEHVCRYRAQRIQGFKVIEAGAGAGMQGIFLSQTNQSTICVEVQPERYRMAKLNSFEYRTGKIRFLHGDIYALSKDFEIDEDTVIFSDPARPPNEQKRTMDTLIPSPLALSKVFGERTKNFVFDLPPQMEWNEISIDGEKEYLSIDGNLNRLTLYCGSLKSSETSAVILPQGIRLSGTPKDTSFPESGTLDDYIIIPDISIVYARLLWKLEELYQIRPAWKEGRRRVYTSSMPVKGEFPGEQYEIQSASKMENLNSALMEAGGGKVIPRFALPDGQYYTLKEKLEANLHGKEDLYIFKRDDIYFVAKRIK